MKMAKKLISIFTAALIAFSFTGLAFAADEPESLPALHTEGEKIVTSDGNEIIFRGTNFGGWGIMEDWFCPYTNPSGEEEVYTTLVSRFGQEKTDELFRLYRSNWITEIDCANVSELGMNVVRLPLWYRNFQSDDKGTWYTKEDGSIDFDELDNVVAMCKKYGLYLILDLHGLPGYQNDYDHCGKSKSMSLFDDTDSGREFRRVVVDFWSQLAAHYEGESTIAMFDLMNEPLGTSITIDKSMQQTFWDFSDELYRAVRAIDPERMICMEAIWDPTAIPSPEVYGWENIVYQEHIYDISNPSVLGKMLEIKRANYGAPFYIGEFYPRVLTTFGYMFSLFNSLELNWTTWTYKGAGPDADSSPWFIYGSSEIEKIDYENDSYETLCEKFGECLRTDSGKFKRNDFADYAANFTSGYYSKACVATFGLIDTAGTVPQRIAMLNQKLGAMKTTVIDWVRKFMAGELL